MRDLLKQCTVLGTSAWPAVTDSSMPRYSFNLSFLNHHWRLLSELFFHYLLRLRYDKSAAFKDKRVLKLFLKETVELLQASKGFVLPLFQQNLLSIKKLCALMVGFRGTAGVISW